MPDALQHLKVLDLSRILAGPWATQILADLGAEVVKVERPGTGDDTRGWGPPFLQDANGQATPDSAYFLSANRGKRSITVDLTTPDGQDLVRALARQADVVVENYKVGTLARYGLGWEDLQRENPALIYCSITGFGQDGPYANLPGYDFVFQGMGGLMSVTGQPPGSPGDEPMKSGVAISDMVAGLYATVAILAAVEHRHLSGRGQHIDLSLLDCTVATTGYLALSHQLSGRVPRRMGNAHPNMVPYQVFRCQEGELIVAVGNDSQFRSLCEAIGRPELATDADFATTELRNRHRERLIPPIAEALRKRTMQDWVERLRAVNVPCGPINDLAQVFQDPHVQHRQMLQTLPHGAGVDAPSIASPIRLSDTPVVSRRSAPRLGEHTGEVLRQWLQLDDSRIAQLRSQGVIQP